MILSTSILEKKMINSSSHQTLSIGVGVIIIKGKKVLLGRRKGPRGAGYYGLPGGYLESSETFEACAKREVLEETGLADILITPIYLISSKSDNIHYIDIIFSANIKKEEPVVKEFNRVEKWEWFDVFNLPTPLYEPTEIAMQQFASNFYFHKIRTFWQNWFPRKRTTILYVDTMNKKNINQIGSV
jgi:8-oxo-dGTP diphosphatase